MADLFAIGFVLLIVVPIAAFVGYEIGRNHGVMETQRRIDEIIRGRT